MFGAPEFAETHLKVTAPESRLVPPDGSYERDGQSIAAFADEFHVPG